MQHLHWQKTQEPCLIRTVAFSVLLLEVTKKSHTSEMSERSSSMLYCLLFTLLVILDSLKSKCCWCEKLKLLSALPRVLLNSLSGFPTLFNTNCVTWICPCLSLQELFKACSFCPSHLQEIVTVKTLATINVDINPAKVADPQAQLAWIYWLWAESRMLLGPVCFLHLLLPV